MHALRFDREVLEQFLLFLAACFQICNMFGIGELGGDIGEHEEFRIGACAGKFVDTFVGKLHGAVLFVDHEIERLGGFGHLACIVLQIVSFGLQQKVLDALLAKEADEGGVLGQTLVGTEEGECSFFAHVLVVACQFGFCLGKE